MAPNRPARIEHLVGVLLAAGSLLLYTRTLAPSLGGTTDSAEFQQVTYSLGIPHPTGYPLYVMLGRAWISLFPFGDPAFRINLLSAVLAALAVWVLYASVVRITGSLLAGAGGAALFAVQAIPWAQASVAEINTLNTLLTGLAFLAVLAWADGRIALPLAALACGLAASHHRTAALYLPLLLVFGLVAVRRTTRRVSVRDLLLAAALFVLPFAAYLYLPLRASTSPGFSFWGTVLGDSALPVLQNAAARSLLPRFLSLLKEIFAGWQGKSLLVLGILGFAVAVGLPIAGRLRARTGTLLTANHALALGLYAAAFLAGLTFAVVYDIRDVVDYLGVPIYMWSVLAGAGIWGITLALTWLAARVALPSRPVQAAAGAAVAILVALSASYSLSRPDVRVDFSGLDRLSFWRQVQAETSRMPQGSILIGDWPEYNEALYLQRIEGWRSDLHPVPLDYLISTDFAQVYRWLDEKQPVYVVGQHYPVSARFSTDGKSTVSAISGRKVSQGPLPIGHALNRRFGDNIILLGYTLEPDPALLSAGQTLGLTLYWQATAPVDQRYSVFNHVIDEQGGKVGQKDGEAGGGSNPTNAWVPGQQVVDSYAITIDAGTLPGTYRLVTGLYEPVTSGRVPAYGQDGKSLGDYPQLAQIEVK